MMNQTVVLNLKVESLHEQNELEKGYKEYILKGSIQDFDAVHYFEVPVEGRDEDEKTEYFRKFTDFIKRKERKVEVEVQADIIQGDEEGTYLFDISQSIEEPNKIRRIRGFKDSEENDETENLEGVNSQVENHSGDSVVPSENQLNGDNEVEHESEVNDEVKALPDKQQKTGDSEQSEVEQVDASQKEVSVTEERLQHLYDVIQSPVIQGDEEFKRTIRTFSRDFLTRQLGEYPKPLIGLFTVITHMSKKSGLDYTMFKENYLSMVNINPETGQLKLFDVLNAIPSTEYMKDIYTSALSSFREDESVEKSLEEYLEEISVRMKGKEDTYHG